MIGDIRKSKHIIKIFWKGFEEVLKKKLPSKMIRLNEDMLRKRIRKLAERTDVTTVITFEYQNQKYKMTIPAGVDYTSLLADEPCHPCQIVQNIVEKARVH